MFITMHIFSKLISPKRAICQLFSFIQTPNVMEYGKRIFFIQRIRKTNEQGRSGYIRVRCQFRIIQLTELFIIHTKRLENSFKDQK